MEQATTLNIVVLISGNGSNLQAIIDAFKEKPGMVNIRAVISNEASAFGLKRAERAGIPHHVIDHTLFSDRQSHDLALQNAIDLYQPDLVVLAGFMRILTPEFVQHYHGRMINIHPSLLPALRGLHTHQRAIQEGRAVHGASIHYVTEELDGGPVIMQGEVPVLPDDDPDTLSARVQVIEHKMYPMVIRWIAEGRLKLDNNRISLDEKILEKPVQYTSDLPICH